MDKGSSTTGPTTFATLQWALGAGILLIAGWFYLLDRTEPSTHFIGPRFFVILLAPFGGGLVGSGLSLRFRWPGWQLLQLAPWVALTLTVAWFRSLR